MENDTVERLQKKEFSCQKTDSTGQLILTDCLVENSALEITIVLLIVLLVLLIAVILIKIRSNNRRKGLENQGTNYYEYDEYRKSFIEKAPPSAVV